MNEGIASIVAGNPERFAGFGSVPLQSVEHAIQELEHAVLDLGLRGVEINTQVNGLNLTDPALGLDPFFQRAQELKAAVFLHPIGFTHAQRLKDHYFNNVIGNPLETTLALSHHFRWRFSPFPQAADYCTAWWWLLATLLGKDGPCLACSP